MRSSNQTKRFIVGFVKIELTRDIDLVSFSRVVGLWKEKKSLKVSMANAKMSENQHTKTKQNKTKQETKERCISKFLQTLYLYFKLFRIRIN